MELYVLATVVSDMSGVSQGVGVFTTRWEAQDAMKQCYDEAFELLCDADEITLEEAQEDYANDLGDWGGYVDGGSIDWHWEIFQEEVEI